MTKRVDPAVVAKEAGETKLEGVFTGQGSPVDGGSRIERRMIPMGRDKQPRPVVVEWRRRKVTGDV